MWTSYFDQYFIPFQLIYSCLFMLCNEPNQNQIEDEINIFFSLRILDDILFSTEIDNPQLFIDIKREFHLIGAIIFNILINPVLFVAVIHFLLL
jgi:hypothetical protein